MLEIIGLSKRYARCDLALSGVDLTVHPGEVVALIGPSGAGKSTLIRCVNRLVEPSEGRIVLDGQDITRLSTRELRRARRKIGMIFQEFALIERLTVMENVLSGRLGYVSFWRSLLRRFPSDDVRAPYRFWTVWDLPTTWISGPTSCLEANDSAWALPGPWGRHRACF